MSGKLFEARLKNSLVRDLRECNLFARGTADRGIYFTAESSWNDAVIVTVGDVVLWSGGRAVDGSSSSGRITEWEHLFRSNVIAIQEGRLTQSETVTAQLCEMFVLELRLGFQPRPVFPIRASLGALVFTKLAQYVHYGVLVWRRRFAREHLVQHILGYCISNVVGTRYSS